MNNNETIAAIATALSESGIGIIRVSGSEAVEIVNKIFFNKSGNQFLLNVATHTINYGYIHSIDDNSVIDECLVSVMLAPRSFTGENTVEINCHGGVYVVKRVLFEVLKAGARMAEPGEFSKRAFLNGRLDLSEAEAVMDVISSKSESSLKASLNQLSGSVSKKIRELRAAVLYEIAFIESALDDPEHISLDGYKERLTGLLDLWIFDINKLIDSNKNGRFLRDGISTVLLGKPNAGKSSIMNFLLGNDRAIVTEIAGTTRDTLEEYVKLDDVSLKLIDTAGIRETDNTVEAIGVERAREAAENADLILYVVDVSSDISQKDIELIKMFPDKNGIVILNKNDLIDSNTAKDNNILLSLVDNVNGYPIVNFSAVTGTGSDELRSIINEMFCAGLIKNSDEVVITNIRHKECLEDCLDSLMNVKNSVDNDMEEDFYSIDLMDAYSSLGKIIGEEIEDDLATEIFSKFCLGK